MAVDGVRIGSDVWPLGEDGKRLTSHPVRVLRSWVPKSGVRWYVLANVGGVWRAEQLELATEAVK